ncbi:membrane protein [Erythrobacter sp. SG61-1L]|uniref:VIT1/CCC1 transporter family protein n=1 Tax=Erythrobacter sp. SG61-1L TaxID=1603897 RepID=UPI0006C91B3A|nr:VIT family protein [Erythrobacter sp. SG61-1L]KPL68696.1 membrane protein [Erythrobacter sp. SG61-1L]
MTGRAPSHRERHTVDRIGWLRAAVLGANDGIVSTASLIVGVAAASADKGPVLVSGIAGLVAGAMSMAAGEYVSVSSQADAEEADLQREKQELATMPEAEHAELVGIYAARGLPADLAEQVANALEEAGTLKAHLRDELGIVDVTRARPVQAALTSAGTFSAGAALPLLATVLLPFASVPIGVSVASLLFLMVLGAMGAQAGNAPIGKAVIRVVFWGAVAMAATYGIGKLFGASVS